MSSIYWEDWFDTLQEEVDYLETLVGQDIADLQNDVNNIIVEQGVQDARLDALELHDYPESLWNLADVNINPSLPEDGKFLKYDFTSDKMILDSVNNFPETIDDGNNYVRYWDPLQTNGTWRTLSSTTEITNLNSE